MNIRSRSRAVTAVLVSLLTCLPRDAFACLRDAPDVRAIQWSTVIVEAKLTGVDEPVELTRLKQAEPGKAELVHVYSYQLFTFDVTDVLDGRVRRAQDLKVVLFAGQIQQPDPDRLPCSQHLRREQIGRSFILVLRPQRDLRIQAATVAPADSDFRTEALHKLNPYAIVNLVPREEVDADEKGALKQLISDTRKVEREYSAQRARQVAERVASTAETPESQAEADELLAMGPRAIPEMTRVWNNLRGPRSGRDRLQTLIGELTPPPIPVAVGGPMTTDQENRPARQ